MKEASFFGIIVHFRYILNNRTQNIYEIKQKIIVKIVFVSFASCKKAVSRYVTTCTSEDNCQ